MTDLFAPMPTDNLLPCDGKVNDLGIVIDYPSALYYALLTTLPWQSDIVTLFGKTHVTTRQIVWMGDSDASYQYSGHTRQAIAWIDSVFHVKHYVEQQLLKIGIHANFNSCLLNYYPSGDEGMGYHADDEKELGDQPIIASLSLGATRKFVFKHKKTQDKVELYLESGQLIVMHGDTQKYWKHSITKTKTVNEGRISLTFRQMALN
ncbi:alpha-ketoglutarate-dependent dioxygenase AlkB family protein [Psychrobacter sp. ANT_WB68]|uniref:alpha-ketoglutarate-dependent dioxygenase AlkB family protein n=1 Tax=Psychrobacter sp. ANT_WB68 TaxID=2597355 RepID=UPI0011F0EA49|nr:alpha-ketoglutarate-dependent dioxygenase AlkB [Psychrobacter sp. ANT_WB68]KAA0913480.1 alpha-ketoglutarate-dependent dioxygenase AlkB [Psychrobacter sp. ANT_WB68]